jgi:hypothetical protein
VNNFAKRLFVRYSLMHFVARHAHVDAGSATMGQKRLKKRKTKQTQKREE